MPAVCRLMLDPEEREEFDFVALNTAVIECKHIAKQTQNPRDSESAELLTGVASSAQQRTLEFGKLFREKSGEASTLPFKSVVRSCSHFVEPELTVRMVSSFAAQQQLVT